ncbi:MAG: DUF7948 domain-containing protein [Aggregatilineales bacterium]
MTDMHSLPPTAGQPPLVFVPNRGQNKPGVQYEAHSMGHRLFFASDEIAILLPPMMPKTAKPLSDEWPSPDELLSASRAAVVQLRFENTNTQPDLCVEQPLSGTINYLIGNDPDQWQTNLPTYRQLVYRELYPGIDLSYEGALGHLKGSYRVAPGSDPSHIRWRYEGATHIDHDEDSGDLRLAFESETGAAYTLLEHAPVAWQETESQRVSVSVRYKLYADGSVGFDLDAYNPAYPLTIDPLLVYSTYLGGTSDDFAYGIALDSNNNIYIGGYTYSTDFPLASAYQSSTNGATLTGFVTKLDPTGTNLIYSTYLGGNGGLGTYAQGGIKVDRLGQVYFSGHCTNSGLPTTSNAYQPTHTPSSSWDAFLAVFNASGSGLVYCTYLGGSSATYVYNIAIDGAGNAYLAGQIIGPTFNLPMVSGVTPFQSSVPSTNPYAVGYIAKLNPYAASGLASLLYTSYVSGGINNGSGSQARSDEFHGITVDASGTAFVVGGSPGFVSPNPPRVISNFLPTGYPTNVDHVFVARINTNGTVPSDGVTYLGGKMGTDFGERIVLDVSGHVYITGKTTSTDFTPIVNAFQSKNNASSGGNNVFIAKLSNDLSTVLYSTYLGGSSDDRGVAIRVDQAGNMYVSGYASSTSDFPTVNSRQPGSGFNAFLSILDATGSQLLLSTFIGPVGSSSPDIAQDLVVNNARVIYVTGATSANGFPVIPTAHPFTSTGVNQYPQDHIGGYDAFIAKFDLGSFFLNTGAPFCPWCWIGALLSLLPVNIQYGEKTEQITDLSLNTPSGKLEFTRSYRQSQLGAFQQPLGLGWTHNHAASLSVTTGTLKTLAIQMPNGGTMSFYQQSSGSTHYVAYPGSTSYVDYASGPDHYTLTVMDKTQYVFENNGGGGYRLHSINWANTPNQTWNYLYYTSGPAVGLLQEVNDNYLSGGTAVRRLQFVYGSFNSQQMLQYVGDQSFNSTTLTGRYVAFNYVPNKMFSGSAIINGPQNVLNSVRDVRGNTWAYAYYGQQATETDPNQLNFLTRELSPAVDPTGSGSSGAPLTLKALNYTMQGSSVASLTQQNGNGALSTSWAFQPNGQNQTTETTAGKTTTHLFNGNTYAGSVDPAGNANAQAVNSVYRPGTQTDARGNATNLGWSTDGGQLNQVTDALGHQTNFTYNTNDTLNTSVDAQGHTSQYVYGDSINARLPTQVKVLDSDGHTLLRWQQFSYDSYGRTLTEQTLDPITGNVQQQVIRGYYPDSLGTTSAGLLQTVTQQDLVNPANNVTTTYFYDSAGRVARTNQSATFGNCLSSFSLYDPAGNVIASLCNYNPNGQPDPTTVAQALALVQAALPNDPTQNQLSIYTYDTLGRRVQVTTNAGQSYAQTALTVYDAMNRVVRTISNYVASTAISDPYVHNRAAFSHGPNNDQNLITDTVYNERGFVQNQTDVLGNVTLFGYDDSGRPIVTIQNTSQPKYDNSSLGADPSLAYYRTNYYLTATASSAPDQDLITVNQYDPTGNLIRSTDPIGNVTLTGYDALNRPVRTIRNASAPNYNLSADPTLAAYIPSTAADRDLIETTQYDALGHVIRTQDTLGSWTLYGYDALGRQVAVVRNASQPNYNLTVDPTLSNYPVNSLPDQDILTQTVYDLQQGRVLYTVDPLGRRTWSAYDGLGRVIKTVVNAVGSATDNGIHDPRSPVYAASSAPDRDQIALTTFDTNGYVLWTQDPLGRRTWQAYDTIGRQIRTISNATGQATDGGTQDPRSARYIASALTDRDLISQTVYDAQGRVAMTIDPLGRQTQYSYDTLGRRIKTIANFVTGTFHAAQPDQDLVSTTTYDLAGRVVATVDPRGTQTTFSYDRLGRRLTVTQAAGTPLATISYTCYDKGGRVLRTIQNYVPNPKQPSPDARDGQGNWLFNPTAYGLANDQNLVTSYTLDRAGRQVSATIPYSLTRSGLAPLTTRMTYFKDGQLESMTDSSGAVTKYRYDGLRRRTVVVQGYVDDSQTWGDPGGWQWTAGQWQTPGGVAIGHTPPTYYGPYHPNSSNLIAQVSYDQVGRVLSQRDPNGNLTTYSYDLLNRRTALTDPLTHTWQTQYLNLNGNQTATVVTDPNSASTQQTFDQAGRLATVQYLVESPKLTPDVTFSYDKGGRRLTMAESNGVSQVRAATYAYDQAGRLTTVSFDVNGNGSNIETVNYQYDPGGLRTALTLPGGAQTIGYSYNARGQLIGLTDWAGHVTRYTYDQAGRLSGMARPNGLLSTYQYDGGGRLTQLRHTAGGSTLAHFNYVPGTRGNRVKILEAVRSATSGVTTVSSSDPTIAFPEGTWTSANGFAVSANWSAALHLAFMGQQVTLKLGQGPDHGICDIYIDDAFWQSFDGYVSTATNTPYSLSIQLDNDGPHTLDLRNRAEKNSRSSAFTVRFYSLSVPILYDLHTVSLYRTNPLTGGPLDGYDLDSRLWFVDYYHGDNLSGTPYQQYDYSYDLAGNRTQQIVTVNGTPTTTNYTYDTANRLMSDGTHSFSYDTAGRLTSDGVNSYSWDRANRLLSVGSTSYLYNGVGQRVQQTVGATVTQYLLDIQPGLAKVLQATTGTNVTNYIHGPTGIQQQQNPDTTWRYPIQDGLGSVRSTVGSANTPLESRVYDPYGPQTQQSGTSQTVFGFTGEETDSIGLVNLRARYYNPAIGQFFNLDPLEGSAGQPLSLNRYAYVQGNPVNLVDPSGMLFWSFPSSSKYRLYNPEDYSTAVQAHAWIEQWLEGANGFLLTQLEYPGIVTEEKIDALIFTDDYFPYGVICTSPRNSPN